MPEYQGIYLAIPDIQEYCQYDMYPDRSMNFCKSSDKQQNNNYIYKQIWLECHDIYLKSSCVLHFYCYLQSAFIWMFNHMQNDSGWWGNILKAFIIILHWWYTCMTPIVATENEM